MTPTASTYERVRNLSREEKLALVARAAERTAVARRAANAAPTALDGSRNIRVRAADGSHLTYRLGPDDLAL